MSKSRFTRSLFGKGNDSSSGGNRSRLDQKTIEISPTIGRGVGILIGLMVLLSVATGTVAAQEDTDADSFMCTEDGSTNFLGGVLQSIINLLVFSAVPVFVVLYQLDGILEFFALGADTKAKIKKHERNLWIGAAKVYLVPVIVSVLATVMGISWPDCITLIPFADI